MRLPISLEPEAAAELDEAAAWYEGQHRGLAAEFLKDIDAALEWLAQWPAAGAPMPGLPADLTVRWVPVGRFPYRIVYLEFEGVLRVLAVAHDRRRPGYWESRLPE